MSSVFINSVNTRFGNVCMQTDRIEQTGIDIRRYFVDCKTIQYAPRNSFVSLNGSTTSKDSRDRRIYKVLNARPRTRGFHRESPSRVFRTCAYLKFRYDPSESVAIPSCDKIAEKKNFPGRSTPLFRGVSTFFLGAFLRDLCVSWT